MLSALSGRNHKVWTCTGILLARDKGDMIYTESAEVFFRDLDTDTMVDLIESSSWTGKAGGYDIHGRASELVEVVEGSEITVLGLSANSMTALREILEK
jgi:septum formation protein